MENLTVSREGHTGERVGVAAGAPDPRALPLSALAAAGGAELDEVRSGQPSCDGSGVELFRRAICQRDPAAWETLAREYRGLVLNWIRQHPQGAVACEADDDQVVRAFERFGRAVTPERFTDFGHLEGLLRYLKLCVYSVLADDVREQAAFGTELAPSVRAAAEARAPAGPAGAPGAERRVLDRLPRHDLWQAVGRALPDEAEQQLVYLSFALGLTPRQIVARHAERYPDVAAVYRAKRNALEQLRRLVQ
jgi:hypothetical protein